MKKYIILTILLFSYSAFSEEKKEFKLTSKVQSVVLETKARYKVQLTNFASTHYADKKYLKCLTEAIDKKKAVELKATAKTHEITSCQISKK